MRTRGHVVATLTAFAVVAACSGGSSESDGTSAPSTSVSTSTSSPTPSTSLVASTTSTSTTSTSSTSTSSTSTSSVAPVTFTWDVDPALSGERAVGIISNGQAESSFVPGRVVLVYDDESELTGLLERRGGALVRDIVLADHGLSGPSIAVVEVDLATADLDALGPAMSSLGVEGTTTFDSDDTARLGAIVAEERASGLRVEFDWSTQTTSIPGSTEEQEVGDAAPVDWSTDAYQLPYYRHDSVQGFGVPEAWTYMYWAGVLDNRVPLAIVDTGFLVDDDFRDPATAAVDPSFLEFGEPADGEGNRAYHGYLVSTTALAVPDNSYGTAGVAGVVASPILVQKGEPSLASGLDGLLQAHAMGAQIVNMSYLTVIIDEWAHMQHAWDALTGALAADGVLMFASSGNDGSQLDHLVADGIIHGTRPCQAPGVVCVGGLAKDSINRHDDSVWSEAGGSVDLWAPYCMYLWRAFSDSPAIANVCGTSISSPFAAGVAALVWASDPSLTAAEVREIMESTAYDTRFPRINALAAVRQAIGSFVGVEFVEPSAGSAHHLGGAVGLAATVAVPTDPLLTSTPVTVRFSSNRDGLLDEHTWTVPMAEDEVVTTQRVSATVTGLSEGSHVITVTATHGEDEATGTRQISVANSPPSDLRISRPVDGDRFCLGAAVQLRGDAFDLNEQLGLAESAFRWSSSRDGALGEGRNRETSSLSAGAHTITMEVVDSDGLSNSASVGITVLSATHPDCVDTPPNIKIVEPDDGVSFYVDDPGEETGVDAHGTYVVVRLQAAVNDDHDAAEDLQVDFYVRPGEPDPWVGSGADSEQRLHLPDGVCSLAKTITVVVFDTAGNRAEDQIEVFVNRFC